MLWTHIKTVIKHRHYVFKCCVRCGIIWRGLVHDLSKFSPAEFIPGARYADGKRPPSENEIKATGITASWLHHKGRNKHHPEYWYDPTHNITPPLPTPYLIEMFCDRLGATMAYKGRAFTRHDPLNYFLAHEERDRPLMNEKTYRQLEYLLKVVDRYGVRVGCLEARKMLLLDGRIPTMGGVDE